MKTKKKGPHLQPGLIEKMAESLGIIPNLHKGMEYSDGSQSPGSDLKKYPSPDKWDDWTEYEAKAWPRKEKKNYMLVPTICFNCESGCGLVAYIDKKEQKIRKMEGNPYHPGSRGRNCAKGPATINQINDPDRILYPMKRDGERGSGKWKRVSWEEAMEDIAGKIRESLKADRRNNVVYHVGRPGHEGYIDRVLNAWGVDGHNSHTNICSAGARFGYALWHQYDRPSADYANADFILLLSAHLESGHYFNPHSQRIIEAKMRGTKLAVMDPRLSNTAARADYWMPTFPGSEAVVFLAMAHIIMKEGYVNKEFMKTWVNWQEYMEKKHNKAGASFDEFLEQMTADYAQYTPEFAAKEAGIDVDMIVEVARNIGRAGTRFATQTWRSASMGNEGGWAAARTLHFLSVLVGAVGTEGGTSPSAWQKIKPKVFDSPPHHRFWNNLHFPHEWPMSHYEMSFILPHLVEDGKGTMDVYFSRVFNPVWTYPDGFSWIEMLKNHDRVGMHIALTPTWNETAYYADYVLPMGHAGERHDWVSYETHTGAWVGFRQPVLRVMKERMGEKVEFTYEANMGEVWEEDEFWIELSWKIDPDSSLGIRKHFISPYRDGEKITINEYYKYAFEQLPGLKEAAEKEGLDPLGYMKKYGAFEVKAETYNKHMSVVKADGTSVDERTGSVTKDGKVVGIMVDGEIREGFPTPSKKQELYSQTMVDWKWPEYATPTHYKSHVHPDNINSENGEFCLLPTFRLPNLIHTRSGSAKWLVEIAHTNPVWMNTKDAEKHGYQDGDMIRVNTEIGYFVNRVFITEGIRPGVVACSHHIGRWRRLEETIPGNRYSTNLVKIDNDGDNWKMRVVDGVRPFKSNDPDTSRIYWSDGGVHQDITHAVHPDPISGAHCWHQWVKLEKAHPGDRYGDVSVNTKKSREVYLKWKDKTRPAPGPDGLRRPLWFTRPLKPTEDQFFMKDESDGVNK